MIQKKELEAASTPSKPSFGPGHPLFMPLWSFLSIYSFWKVLFSWNENYLPLGREGVFRHFPILKESLGSSGIIPFHFGQGGGILLHPAEGFPSLERILHGMGFDLIHSISYSMFWFQALAVHFTLAFIKTWRKLYWSDFVLSSLLIGFSPSLMTRFSLGQIEGIVPFFIIPALAFLASTVRRGVPVGMLDLFLLTFGISQILSSGSFQSLLVSLLVALPLLFGAVGHSGGKARKEYPWLLWGLFLPLTALTFSWTELKSLLETLAHGEIQMNASGAPVGLPGLFQSLDFVSSLNPSGLKPEVGLPCFGLLAFFGILYSKGKRYRRILALVLVPSLLLLPLTLLGMPWSRPLAGFTIPFLTLLACLVLLRYRSKEKVSPREFLIVGAGIILGCCGSWIHPGVSVALEFLGIGFLLLRTKRRWAFHAALGILVGSSLFGALERKTEYLRYQLNPNSKDKINQGSTSILERSEYLIPGSPVNAGMFTGTYGLSFSLKAQKSFLELLAAFTGSDESQRITADFSSPNSPSFFKALLNSVHEIKLEEEKLVSRKVRDSHPIRIPFQTAHYSSADVVKAAQSRETGMHYILNVLDSPEAPASLPAHCKTLKANIEKATIDEIRVSFQGNTDGCYAVFPINYSNWIEARAGSASGSFLPLKTLRSHQTLLAVALRGEARTIILQPKIVLTRVQLTTQLMLGLLFIILWGFYRKKRGPGASDLVEHA